MDGEKGLSQLIVSAGNVTCESVRASRWLLLDFGKIRLFHTAPARSLPIVPPASFCVRGLWAAFSHTHCTVAPLVSFA